MFLLVRVSRHSCRETSQLWYLLYIADVTVSQITYITLRENVLYSDRYILKQVPDLEKNLRTNLGKT